VISQLSNQNCIISNFVNKSMLVIDSPGPVAGKCMFQGFRFANTLKRVAFSFLNESVDTVKNFLISFLPIDVIVPGMIRKNELHSINSLSFPSPFSSWAIDSISRLVFLGDRNRYAVSSRDSKSSRDIITTDSEDFRVTMIGAWSRQTFSIVLARFCLAAV